MISYFLKLAIRNLRYRKLISVSSILTVTIGAICLTLLASYVINEESMDGFHKRKMDIYMVVVRNSPESEWDAIEANLFFGFDYRDYPEVENLTTIKKYNEGEVTLLYKELKFTPEVLVVDSMFFNVFDFRLRTGAGNALLSDPDAAIISERLAGRIFGNEDPLGQAVTILADREKTYTVKGIAEDPPSNSSINFDVILPDHSARFSRSGANFILAASNFDQDRFIKKIENLGQQHPQFTESKLGIISLNDIYFNKGYIENANFIFSRSGDRRTLDVLYIILAIILVVTIVNYSYLQIVQINSGLRQSGINRINGARTRHYMTLRMFELLIMIVISTFLVTGFYYAILPYYNDLTGTTLLPSLWQILLLILAILVSITGFAMLYPLGRVLRFPVTTILKGWNAKNNRLKGRKPGLVVQFSLAIVLIISSVVVARQLGMMLNQDLGFISANVIRLKMFHELPFYEDREEAYRKYLEQQEKYQYVKNEMSSNPSIAGFTEGDSPIETYPMEWKLKNDPNEYTSQKIQVVSPSHQDVLGLQLVEGRFFEPDIDMEGRKVVINEAAMKYWNIKDITRERLLNSAWSRSEGYEIIGIIRDFNYDHLSVRPQPLMMLNMAEPGDDFLIRFEAGATEAGLSFVKQLFEKVNPGEVFQYSFISDDIASLYLNEKRLSKVCILFTLAALFITATGLFAISLHDAQRRTKEIGIRKVNGAKVSEIMTLLNADYLKWVGFAFVLAMPASWYLMSQWLQNFAYKTSLGWWIFVAAGLLAIGIAMLTVSLQSYRAASRNPVEALRYE